MVLSHINLFLLEPDIVVGILCVALTPTDYSRKSLVISAIRFATLSSKILGVQRFLPVDSPA